MSIRKDVAHLDQTAVLDTAAKFFRVMKNAGVPFDAWKLPNQDKEARKRLAAFMNAGCPDFVKQKQSLEGWDESNLAENIFGGRFVSVAEAAKAWKGKLKYGRRLSARLNEALPGAEALRGISGSHVLVPLPPRPMSLIEMRDLAPGMFRSDNCWYEDGGEKFFRNDRTGEGWIALLEGPVSGSLDRPWDRQEKMVPAGGPDTIPNAPSFAWALLTYLRARNIRLFTPFYGRTSSVASSNFPVGLGFDADGLNLVSYWVGHPGVGVASARIVPL
ncbi:hypothetical protein JW899_00925 [Candidatus Uhrbacteria bacterium]|nr:hypothetical protein [Candidatus Uhrbacteria bacterium]